VARGAACCMGGSSPNHWRSLRVVRGWRIHYTTQLIGIPAVSLQMRIKATATPASQHSAQVKMQLLINGSSIPIAQAGPDFLLLNEPFDHPPCVGRFVLQVDQDERQWDVRLPDGMSASSKRVSVRRSGPTCSAPSEVSKVIKSTMKDYARTRKKLARARVRG
jgi:hypothetical protein